jgi:integrase
MKLPNGYGSIVKLSGKRRKPYCVRITTGVKSSVKDDGTVVYAQDRKMLGCYRTKAEALKALEDYNSNPYCLDDMNITFSQLYANWKKIYYDKLGASAKTTRDTSYRYCSDLYDIPIRQIKLPMLQEVVDKCPHGSSTKKNIKTAIKTVYQTAIKNDIVHRDLSEYIEIESSDPIIERTVFTPKEISILWEHQNEWDYAIILILLYSGMRVNELLKNNKNNVNLEKRWIYVPKELAKNTSSVRYVPIHDRIMPIMERFYDKAKTDFITNEDGYTVKYNNFVSRNLKKINKEINADHRFHDTRHTFITRCHEQRLDDLTVKKIVGHSPDGITAKVYTHIELAEMLEEINKLKL